MKNRYLVVAALAGLAFVGCSNNEEELYADFTGPVEVQFSGDLVTEVVQSSAWTRAYEDGYWDSEETCIGINPTYIENQSTSGNSISSYFNVKYIGKTDGDMQQSCSFTSGNPIYFQSASEKVIFTAYAPYTDEVTSSGIVYLCYDDTNTVPDYIFAKATEQASYSSPNVTLPFKHVMSRLTVNASSSDGTAISEIRLSGLSFNGYFNTRDGSSSAFSGEVPDITVDGGSRHIIIPQTVEKFVITLTTSSGETYSKTYNNMTFSSGISYNITARKSGLDVSASIDSWEDKDYTADATVSEGSMVGTFNEKEQVQLYDLVFSDGSFMRIVDDYNSVDVSELTAEQLSKLRGVVYYLNEVSDVVYDSALQSDYPSCNHGLILALNDAPTSCWQLNSCSIVNVLSTYSVSLGSNIDYCFLTDINVKVGYNNTKALQKYNELLNAGCLGYYGNNYAMIACTYLTDGSDFAENYIISSNTSDWYIPSHGDFSVLDYNRMERLSEIVSALQSRANSLGVPMTIHGLEDGKYYWTSTEIDALQAYALYVCAFTGNLTEWTKTTEKDTYLCPICAF